MTHAVAGRATFLALLFTAPLGCATPDETARPPQAEEDAPEETAPSPDGGDDDRSPRAIAGGEDKERPPQRLVSAESTKPSASSKSRRRPTSKGRSARRAKGERPVRRPLPPPPPRDGTFFSAGMNPRVATAVDPLSTFAIDVDTGSYFYAKSTVERGRRVHPDAVRVEEWVNAFHYDYPDPDEGPFAVHIAAGPSPFDPAAHLMRVAVQGKRLLPRQRQPVHITFLVDVSGSMRADDKLPLAKRAMHILVDNLRDDDRVAIVTYAGATAEVLPSTPAQDRRAIRTAIDALRSSGGTRMDSGMKLAFRNAGKHLSDEVMSRVVVLSDGDANIGLTVHDEILREIRGYVSEGVTLSTVGFGHGNYNDHLMEQLADAGNGNHHYVDSEATARKLFETDLVQNLQVIAQDVKVQVAFNPEVVSHYRLLGYENRDIADRDFRNDKKDAGEIGAGHTVTALYEVSLVKGASKQASLATVRVRHKAPRAQTATEKSWTFARDQVRNAWEDLDDDTRFAAAVALTAELLRQSPHAAGLTWSQIRPLALRALGQAHVEERHAFVLAMSHLDQAPQTRKPRPGCDPVLDFDCDRRGPPLSSQQVLDEIGRHKPAIRACTRRPGAGGTIRMKYGISPEGRPLRVRTDHRGAPTPVETCLVEVFSAMRYPRSGSGVPSVELPLTMAAPGPAQ